jgi:pimeloyl-ACP methyl ester carboxylesterase
MPDVARRVAEQPPENRGTVVPLIARVLWPIMSTIAIASRRFPADVVQDFGRQSLGARADTMWSLLADTTVLDELGPLRQLPADVPTLLLAAADDRYVRQHTIGRWRQFLPNAELRQAPMGGHQFLLRVGFEPIVEWLDSLPVTTEGSLNQDSG